MSTVTTAGTGTLTTLMVSTGTGLLLPQYQYTSLLQGANSTITGSNTTILFLGQVSTSHDSACEVTITVDGSTILDTSAGGQIILRFPLSTGSHTIEFTAFSLAHDVTAETFGLTIIDLGL